MFISQNVFAFHFLNSFFFQHFRDAPPLNTVSGLLDLSLFWLVLVTGSLILFVWTFGNKLLVIFHTQVNSFPLLVLFTDRSLNPILIIVALFGIAQARHNPGSSNICKTGLLASWRAYHAQQKAVMMYRIIWHVYWTSGLQNLGPSKFQI